MINATSEKQPPVLTQESREQWEGSALTPSLRDSVQPTKELALLENITSRVEERVQERRGPDVQREKEVSRPTTNGGLPYSTSIPQELAQNTPEKDSLQGASRDLRTLPPQSRLGEKLGREVATTYLHTNLAPIHGNLGCVEAASTVIRNTIDPAIGELVNTEQLIKYARSKPERYSVVQTTVSEGAPFIRPGDIIVTGPRWREHATIAGITPPHWGGQYKNPGAVVLYGNSGPDYYKPRLEYIPSKGVTEMGQAPIWNLQEVTLPQNNVGPDGKPITERAVSEGGGGNHKLGERMVIIRPK